MGLLLSFKGTVGRKNYFVFGLLYLIAYGSIVEYSQNNVITLSFFLYIYLNLTLTSKRLRDAGYSPWLTLLFYTPVVGQIMYIFLLFKKGKTRHDIVKKESSSRNEVVKKVPVASLKEIQGNVLRILNDSMS